MRISIRLLLSMLPVFLFAQAFLVPGSAGAAEVTLRWDAPASDPSSADIAGYNVYFGRTSHNYRDFVYAGNTTTCTVGDLAAGTWYFAVTAVDNWGNESEYSNEVRSSFGTTASPYIQSLSVSRGIEGTPVTVSGENFGDRKGAVYVGTKKARVVQWSSAGDSIAFLSPKKLPYDTYEVGVITAKKERSDNALPYQVMQANITGSSASSGAPGDTVTLTGEYLGPRPKVCFTFREAGKAKRRAARVTGYSVTDHLNSTIEFMVPELDTGHYVITVVNSQGISDGWSFEVR